MRLQYISGRPTTAIPRVASASEFIEPTQGFDCHESVISPDARDSLQNKFDRSQVLARSLARVYMLILACSLAGTCLFSCCFNWLY